MRALRLGALCALAALPAAATPAAAAVPHTVTSGETLWSIAAANNFTTNALAAYNGLSPEAQVVLGSTIQIPSEGEAAAALGGGATAAPTTATPATTSSTTVQGTTSSGATTPVAA